MSVTADAVTRGASSRVDLGGVSIDGGEEILFVNTASIGGYPDSVRLRDKWSSRIGKWPAAAAAMVAVLAVAEPMHVEIDGRRTKRFDYDALEQLLDFRHTARARGIDYRLVGVPEVETTPSH